MKLTAITEQNKGFMHELMENDTYPVTLETAKGWLGEMLDEFLHMLFPHITRKLVRRFASGC